VRFELAEQPRNPGVIEIRHLRERRGSQGTKLSGGEQQMLAIARILRTGARLLLLDEPTEGLAPVIVQQIGATIRRLKSEGFTILLVEQNFRFAATVADRHYVMEHGRVVDAIVTRGLKNTFRFGPGFGVIAKTALDNLVTINDQADKAAKTVMIVHEDSAFGAGLAKLLNTQLPERGFQILETIAHPTPTRDFNNVVLKIRAQNPDLVIPANYYNEYVLLARTMQQQRVRPKGIYSVLGGAASSYKFVKEFPEAAQYIMDCNHWFDPKNPKALALKKKIEEKGEFYTYEVYMNYSCVLLLADALERAAGADRAKIIGALESSTFAGHVMPYGPTKFVNGQNQGAAPVNTQVVNNDIQVIFPAAFASAKPVFPMPRA